MPSVQLRALLRACMHLLPARQVLLVRQSRPCRHWPADPRVRCHHVCMPAQAWLNACLPRLVSPLACLCAGAATCLPYAPMPTSGCV